MLTNLEKRLITLDAIITVGFAAVAVLTAVYVNVWFALLGIVPAIIVVGDTYRYLQIRRERRVRLNIARYCTEPEED